jgi:hypothetical protein
MNIHYTCTCGQRLQAQSEDVGRRMRCPACGQEATVPDDAKRVEAAEAPAIEVAPARRRRQKEPFEEHDEDRSRWHGTERTSGKATAALVFGFLAFCLSLLAGVPAIVLGVLSLSEISRSRGRLRGRGTAITGIVLGAVGGFLIGPALLISLQLTAVQRIRNAAQRLQSANNMKQLTLAIYNYVDTHGQFPPAVVFGSDGRPLYSWRVLLLPYLEQDNLYHRFRLDEPWDSPNNRPLLAMMPKVFQDPADTTPQLGLTPYQVFDGPGAPFDSSSRPFRPFQPDGAPPLRLQMSAFQIRLTDFTDGTANTILIVESADPVPWTSPQDLPFGPGVPLPKLGRPSRGGFNAAYADATVKTVPSSISEQTLRALITPNAGDIPGNDAP